MELGPFSQVDNSDMIFLNCHVGQTECVCWGIRQVSLEVQPLVLTTSGATPEILLGRSQWVQGGQ